MLSLLRRMFAKRIAKPWLRFSNDVRAATGYSNSIAIACGAERINTAHLLAAVASHPDGNALLGGRASWPPFWEMFRSHPSITFRIAAWSHLMNSKR